MGNGIYSAVSGAVAQSRYMEVVANNLANISTAGFKADKVSFAEVLSNTTKPGAPPSKQSFVRTDEVRMDMRQGGLRQTEGQMDVAMEGPGFLTLLDGNRTIFSRGGTLQVRADGVLADNDGLPLIGLNNKPLRPGAEVNTLTISSDGTVQADGQRVGVLKIVEFESPHLLKRLGNTHYEAPPKVDAQIAQLTKVRQGSLEMANVNMVHGINSMIVASRTYEAFHRLLSTFSQIDAKTASMGRSGG